MRIRTWILLISATVSLHPLDGGAQSLKGRAVWGHPGVAGTNRESVAEFADQLAGAHINTLVMMVKGVGGDIYWPSERFADCVRDAYKTFDFPAVLIEECHARGIEVHAWFCDFPEGPASPSNERHPDWAMLDAEGQPTDSEILRGRRYGMRWMCPARRPGYTDQWLIPMIAEFAARYDIDAIHHDYVRYPGDLAPDQYCFCDYCLEEIPKFAGFYKQAYPDEAFSPEFDRPYLEAHWEPGPRVLPHNWASMPRRAKSRFLLEGSFFAGGRYDLDYFFYQYRVHWIREFAREVAETVRETKPDMEFSAAVFKNPLHSGRFIGQDWRGFSDWVQYLMPMDYRYHYPGTFEQHLDLLGESIQRQKEWARDAKHLWPGIASYQLYKEEGDFHSAARRMVRRGLDAEELRPLYKGVESALKKLHPDIAEPLGGYCANPSAENEAAARDALNRFLEAHPEGFRPPDKFVKTLRRARDTGVEGLVVFSIDDVIRSGLLDELGAFFAE